MSEAHQSALQKVSLLHQLTMEAVLSENKQELIFRILNRSVMLCSYDRATIWDFTSSKTKLLGISGQSSLPKNSEVIISWKRLIQGLKSPKESQVLKNSSFDSSLAIVWDGVINTPQKPQILWLPILHKKRVIAGVWLERWNGQVWREQDQKLLKSLMVSYGAAWSKLVRSSKARSMFWKTLRQSALIFFVLILALLFFVKIPLRVVGSCEVAPEDPFVVTAPVDGVIEEINVQPGQEVRKGELLFRYDKRVSLEELKVARQQVQIIQSSLKRSSLQAFHDPKARNEIEINELKLEQEKIRLRLAEYKVSKLDIYAERNGRIICEDPNEWRGKPVAVGQKVLMIVNPQQTKVRIWLPPDDNVPFDLKTPTRVYLNAFPEKTLTAELSYIADSVTVKPDGQPAILAEGKWLRTVKELKIGLQGHATLFGNTVSLGYWLFRKPMAWARMTFGL